MEIRIEDKTKFIETMKDRLTVDPKTTAIVAVDMHQGHLDPEIATMLVDEDERQRVLKNSLRLIAIARQYKIPVIHVIFQLRPIENKHKYIIGINTNTCDLCASFESVNRGFKRRFYEYTN